MNPTIASALARKRALEALFRYFLTTDARVAVLTNPVAYKFFSDIDSPNKMEDKPFFTQQLDAVRKQ